MQAPKSPSAFYDLLTSLGTAKELAAGIGTKEVTARMWRIRGVPSKYWVKIIAFAKSKNLSVVTAALLADLAAKDAERTKPENPPDERAAA